MPRVSLWLPRGTRDVMRKVYLIDELVAQWHKMRLALESQQQRLAEGQVEGERLTSEEYQARIGELGSRLNQHQKQMVATSAIAERKLSARRS